MTNTNIKEIKEMQVIKAYTTLEGELHRLQAIKYCLGRSDDNKELAIDGMMMSIDNIRKALETLNRNLWGA